MVYKIGLDFHGVITARPKEFAVFCGKMRQKGVMVYIISGGPKKDVADFLDRYQIEYDRIWAILDNCEQNGGVQFFEDGSFNVPTEIWDTAKAQYCATEGILFHIDDSQVYGQYFVTPYCRYDIKSGLCMLDGRAEINLNAPEKAADLIFKLLESEYLKHNHGCVD